MEKNYRCLMTITTRRGSMTVDMGKMLSLGDEKTEGDIDAAASCS